MQILETISSALDVAKIVLWIVIALFVYRFVTSLKDKDAPRIESLGDLLDWLMRGSGSPGGNGTDGRPAALCADHGGVAVVVGGGETGIAPFVGCWDETTWDLQTGDRIHA